MTEEEKLRARVANLETIVHAQWAILRDLQPPGAQDAVGWLMMDHFNAMLSLDGRPCTEFIRPGRDG